MSVKKTGEFPYLITFIINTDTELGSASSMISPKKPSLTPATISKDVTKVSSVLVLHPFCLKAYIPFLQVGQSHSSHLEVSEYTQLKMDVV
jgi:hypothetical protein